MSKYIGTPVVSLVTDTVDVTGDITTTDATPEVIIVNDTSEDTDGGREGKVTFKGQQSGGEETTLAQIQASHDGTSDDEKGDLIFKTNDGSDGASPTERMRIDSAGNVGIGNTAPARHLSVNSGSSSGYIQLVNTNSGTGASNGLEIKLDSGGAHVDFTNRENGYMRFLTNNTERMRIDNSGNVGIGTSSPNYGLHLNDSADATVRFQMTNSNTGTGTGDGFQIIQNGSSQSNKVNLLNYENSDLAIWTNGTQRVLIDNDGDFYVGTTNGNPTGNHVPGMLVSASGQINIHRDAGNPMRVGRSDTGTVLELYRQGGLMGRIGVTGAGTYYGDSDVGLFFDGALDAVAPFNTNTPDFRDNAIDMGTSSARFDDIRATNGTIQTSDENEKEQIASLTDAEITAAKAISKLFKTYKWRDKVAAKGDAARTHTGMVAQQVQTAMSDAGLDVTKYAFWCSDTWWENSVEVTAIEANEDEGIEGREAYTRYDIYKTAEEAPEGSTQKTRLGLRYPELLAFIGAATEQRLTSIEARLDALEGE